MEMYLGVKLVEAEPMRSTEATAQRLHTNSIVEDGYKVVYENGYVSWSPKDAFEKAYRRIDGLTFGIAIEALKQGKRVARKGWNGIGMFIFMRPADELHIDTVIDKVKSLPQSVKDYYLCDVLDENSNRVFPADENDKVKFTAYLCMKAADGTIVNGWLASQTDILAEDWKIIG